MIINLDSVRISIYTSQVEISGSIGVVGQYNEFDTKVVF